MPWQWGKTWVLKDFFHVERLFASSTLDHKSPIVLTQFPPHVLLQRTPVPESKIAMTYWQFDIPITI